jgi:hypothetical protein
MSTWHQITRRWWYVERDGERGYTTLAETTEGLVWDGDGFGPKTPERLAWEAASLELEARRTAEGLLPLEAERVELAREQARDLEAEARELLEVTP